MRVLQIIPGFPTNIEPYRMKWLEAFIFQLGRFVDLDVFVLDSVVHYLKPEMLKRCLKKKSLPCFLHQSSIKINPVRYVTFPGYWFYKRVTLKRIESAFLKNINSDFIQKFDLVHAHFNSPCGELALKLNELYHIPYVITEHASHFDFLLGKGLRIKESLKNSSRLFCVSPFQKEEILKQIAYGMDRIELMPMGVDFEKFKPAPKEKKNPHFRLLFVGALIERKGAEILIEAFSHLSSRFSYELRIIGDGELESNLKSLVARLGLSNQIVFLGAKVERDLIIEYQKCDIFVAPSLKESFGVTLVEALACGKPVVSTCCGGPEWIIHDKNGILSKPGDSKDLKEKIEFCTKRIDEFDSEFIRNDSFKRFSQERLIKKQVSIYDSVLSETK